jgi:CheY-like chemotaxis protein
MHSNSPRFRILLVDDEPMIRELVQAMLEEDGIDVRCVPDGAQAIQEARREAPHLVLLDVVLPGLDGFAVCRLLRADPALKQVPIYMLTAKVRPADHESARRAGASGYIEKPFKAQQLQKLVGDLRKAPS